MPWALLWEGRGAGVRGGYLLFISGAFFTPRVLYEHREQPSRAGSKLIRWHLSEEQVGSPGEKLSQKAPQFWALLGHMEMHALGTGKKRGGREEKLRGREEKQWLPGKGQDPGHGCHQHPRHSAAEGTCCCFKGRGGKDETLAGSGMWPEGTRVGWGELEAREFPHLSILTSSWAPAKDKTVGMSAGSVKPSVKPRPTTSTVFQCLIHVQFLLSLCIPPFLSPLPWHQPFLRS